MITADYEGCLLYALNFLGSTPKEVADSLVKFWVYGKPKSNCECPISNYLKNLTYIKPVVNLYTITTAVAPLGKLIKVEVDSPEAITDFLRAFDYSKEFSFLEQK